MRHPSRLVQLRSDDVTRLARLARNGRRRARRRRDRRPAGIHDDVPFRKAVRFGRHRLVLLPLAVGARLSHHLLVA